MWAFKRFFALPWQLFCIFQKNYFATTLKGLKGVCVCDLVTIHPETATEISGEYFMSQVYGYIELDEVFIKLSRVYGLCLCLEIMQSFHRQSTDRQTDVPDWFS